MKSSPKTVLLLLGLIVVVWILISLGQQQNKPLSANYKPEPTTMNRSAVLLCEECAEEGIRINLWTSPEKKTVNGSLAHNTKVTVVDSGIHEGMAQYKVIGVGQTGWVSELFVHFTD